MKNKLQFLIAPAFLCWCLFYLQSCSNPAIDNNDPLGNNGLNVGHDTLKLKIVSEFAKPVVSSGSTLGVLGSINDPHFGKSYSGFYAQPRLTSNSVSFGESPVLDSAVLTLRYNGTYGKFTQPIDLSVFEVTDNMFDSVTYFTNSTFHVNPSPIGGLSGFTPDLVDSVNVLGFNQAPHMRIHLTNNYGNKILLADAATLLDNPSFVSVVKGFYIAPNSSITGNGIVYIDMFSALSKITLYYHNSASDSLLYDLPLIGTRINHFDNIYTGTPVEKAVNQPLPTGEEKFYIQAGAGVRGKIFIPSLDSFPKNRAINKAELIVSVSPTDTTYPAPLVLDLFRIDDAGQGQHLEDEGLASFNGTLEQEVVNGVTINRYRFNIRYFFQKLLQGVYRNNGFYLQSSFENKTSERVVLTNSSTDKNYQVSLVVTYTKL